MFLSKESSLSQKHWGKTTSPALIHPGVRAHPGASMNGEMVRRSITEPLRAGNGKALFDRQMRNLMAYGQTGEVFSRAFLRQMRNLKPPHDQRGLFDRRRGESIGNQSGVGGWESIAVGRNGIIDVVDGMRRKFFRDFVGAE